MVEAFLLEEANVSYCARNVSGDEFTSFLNENNIKAAASGSIVDICDATAVRSWVEKAAAAFGGIDVVVANGT
jgi:3-oxoacyl-[acyl-carrier protein] reductase